MKKLLFLSIVFISFLSNAQFTLLNETTGDAIVDGSVITVSEDRFLTHVIMTNTGTVSIKATLEVVSITNTNGAEMGQLCFGIHGQGICNSGITAGSIYNSNVSTDTHGNYNYLLAGESTGSNDIDFMHVEHGIDPDNLVNFTSFPKDYVFKITAYDSTTDAVVGTPITFTYRITSSASAEEFSADNRFTIFANSQRQLVVKTDDNIKFAMYNLTGQQVINRDLSAGMHKLSIAKLPAGIYMVYAKSSAKQIYRKLVIQ